MARRPFDPKRAAGGVDAGKPARREQRLFENVADATQMTVTQVNELIKTTLEARIPSPLLVVGQVSNLNCPGHWYFSLKDEGGVLSCVAWATSAAKFGFIPQDGDEVVATGHVSHFAAQGRTQLYVSALKPVGAGALELRFRAMCDALRTLGYFEEARKKPLPVFPRRIAVVTSASGAALQDVLATAAQRCRAVAILVVDVRVQGEGAAEQVARAIRWVDANRVRMGIDATLVTRGGGSMEDLWAFNERVVADAVFGCSIPLVAAIGHESDTTVIELVADLRAATPTQAVMRLVPSRIELQRHIEHESHRLSVLIRRSIDRQRHRLHLLEVHPLLSDPRSAIQARREHVSRAARDLERVARARLGAWRLDVERLATQLGQLRPQDLAARRRQEVAVVQDRLRRALRRRVERREALRDEIRRLTQAGARHIRARGERLAAIQRQLDAIGPHRVLARGYSVTTRADGRLVRSITDVREGQQLTTRVVDGEIESVVGRTGRGARRSSRDRTGAGEDQMDLFGLVK